MESTLMRPLPKFLIPTSNQYGPLDQLANRIVTELARRDFKIPGLEVELDVYGNGDERYRHVCSVTDSNHDFRLDYRRSEGRHSAGHYNECCALSSVIIPMLKLDVHEDYSSGLYIGVGDWEEIKESFICGPRIHEKMDGKRQTHVRYRQSLSTTGGSHYRGRLNEFFVADNDCGRSYTDNAPQHLRTEGVIGDVVNWLTQHVLPKIVAVATTRDEVNAEEIAAIFPDPQAIPVKEGLGPFFLIADEGDGLLRKLTDPNNIKPHEKQAVRPSHRLLSLGCPHGDMDWELAHDGYVWMGFGDAARLTKLEVSRYAYDFHVSGLSNGRLACRFTPNRANELYVIDNAAYTEARDQYWRDIEECHGAEFANKHGMPDSALNAMLLKRAQTLVPLNEYDGSYRDPILMSRREIDLDEVEVLSRYGSSSLDDDDEMVMTGDEGYPQAVSEIIMQLRDSFGLDTLYVEYAPGKGPVYQLLIDTALRTEGPGKKDDAYYQKSSDLKNSVYALLAEREGRGELSILQIRSIKLADPPTKKWQAGDGDHGTGIEVCLRFADK